MYYRKIQLPNPGTILSVAKGKRSEGNILEHQSIFWSRLGFELDPPQFDENGKLIEFGGDYRLYASYHKDMHEAGIRLHTSILHSGWVGPDRYALFQDRLSQFIPFALSLSGTAGEAVMSARVIPDWLLPDFRRDKATAQTRSRQRPFERLMPPDVRCSWLDCQADIQLFRLSFYIISQSRFKSLSVELKAANMQFFRIAVKILVSNFWG